MIKIERIRQIKEELDDVEWYTPTIPLSWRKYHEIIRELCSVIEANQKENLVSNE